MYKIVYAFALLILLCSSAVYAQETVTVEDIVVAAWDVRAKYDKEGKDVKFTKSEMKVVDFFRDQAMVLHNEKKITLSKTKTAYFMAGQSVVTLGTFVHEVKSDKDMDNYADKLIKHGRSILPNKKLSNQEALAVSMIMQCYKNL